MSLRGSLPSLLFLLCRGISHGMLFFFPPFFLCRGHGNREIIRLIFFFFFGVDGVDRPQSPRGRVPLPLFLFSRGSRDPTLSRFFSLFLSRFEFSREASLSSPFYKFTDEF